MNDSSARGGFRYFELRALADMEPPRAEFLRGDCNGDGDTGGVTDSLMILTRNFVDAGSAAPCIAACDVNGDGDTSGVTDAIALLTANFVGGIDVPPPFPSCGVSDSASDRQLGCATNTQPCGAGR